MNGPEKGGQAGPCGRGPYPSRWQIESLDVHLCFLRRSGHSLTMEETLGTNSSRKHGFSLEKLRIRRITLSHVVMVGRKCLLLAGRLLDQMAFLSLGLWALGLYLQRRGATVLASTSLSASLLLGPGLWHQISSSNSSAGQVTLFGAPGTCWVNDWVPLEVNTEAGPWPDRTPLSPTHVEATIHAVPTPCFLYPHQRGQTPPSSMSLPSRHRLQPAPCFPASSRRVCHFPPLLGPALAHLALGWTDLGVVPADGHQKSGRSTAGS